MLPPDAIRLSDAIRKYGTNGPFLRRHVRIYKVAGKSYVSDSQVAQLMSVTVLEPKGEKAKNVQE